ncbi:FGGY-family carbohydrate kinase [Pararhizobium haloflavum]|uniref:FGGY-family carbohydrate kinase n=1 Tax=Pararhizobium haloflavum TaxID=2037914 RepID=UPI0018E462C2|nr:FGGY-family carbohydrate kinase [Pararhizobium haloflavum]
MIDGKDDGLKRAYVVAVDVGTGSARAGVLDRSGVLLSRAEEPIAMNMPRPGHAEHDSGDIWHAVCRAVKAAREAAGVPASAVAGIGFDATCSTVVLTADGAPVSVSTSGEARWDTIVWLDHRALAEADECTATGHRVLDYIGGVMSPEMATPKLAWLKRNLPDSWARAGLLFDLADFLTFKASGSTARSQCTLTCKWTFLAHEAPGWQMDYLAAIGLDDLIERGGLPDVATPVGADLGPLTRQAADELGLTTDCRVASGLIDAHAGALGVLGGFLEAPATIDRHLALVAGTSSCVAAFSLKAKAVRGVWGPYFGAGVPDLWLSEGGQSATGALLDHVIRIHGAGLAPDRTAHRKIAARIGELRASEGETFADRLHVLPDFHGNRSPLGDPHALGVVSGLSLDASFDALCRLYYRTAVSIALGVRHILEQLNANGYTIDTLHVTGGHTKNPLLMALYADATGCAVVETESEDAVLLGTGMLAASAAGWFGSLAATGVAMHRQGRARQPDVAAAARLERDYAVFLAMHRHRRELDRLAVGDTA